MTPQQIKNLTKEVEDHFSYTIRKVSLSLQILFHKRLETETNPEKIEWTKNKIEEFKKMGED